MNSKYKILIIEDEILIAESLKSILIKNGAEVCAIAHSKATAIQEIKQANFDIAFVDIKLKNELAGIELSEIIRKESKKPFIFLTAFSEKKIVEKATKNLPAAYLLKPFTENDIITTLKLVTTKIEIEQQNREFIYSENKTPSSKIFLDEIIYIKVDNIYLEVVTKSKKSILRYSLDKFLSEINYDKIIRVHRSYAVNSDFIEKEKYNYLIVSGNKIPLSRTFKKNLPR